MFSRLGPLEITIIAVILITLFGGKRVADFIRGMGKGVEEYRDSKKEE